MKQSFDKKSRWAQANRSVTYGDSSCELQIKRKFNNAPLASHTQRNPVPVKSINMPRKQKHFARQLKAQDVMINVDKRFERNEPGPSNRRTITKSEERPKRLLVSLPTRNRIFEPLGLDKERESCQAQAADQTVSKTRNITIKSKIKRINLIEPVKKIISKEEQEVEKPEAKKKRSELNPILPPGKEFFSRQSGFSLSQTSTQKLSQETAEPILLNTSTLSNIEKRLITFETSVPNQKHSIITKLRRPRNEQETVLTQPIAKKLPQKTNEPALLKTSESSHLKQRSLKAEALAPNQKRSIFSRLRRSRDEQRSVLLRPLTAEPIATPSASAQDSAEMMRIFPQKDTYDPAKMTTSERNKMAKEIKIMKKRRFHSRSHSRSSSPSLPPHLQQPVRKRSAENDDNTAKVNYIEISSPSLSPKEQKESESIFHQKFIAEILNVEGTESQSNDPSMPQIPFVSPQVILSKQDDVKLIPFFTNKFVFSNHFPCPGLRINGKKFCCTEQYYMWRKAKFYKNEAAATAILMLTDPKQMKLIGSSLDKVDERAWKKVSWKYMIEANLEKFRQFDTLRFQLFRTLGGRLVEASPSDLWWGVGLEIGSENLRDQEKWKGKNMMGKILMEIRDFLSDQREFSNEVCLFIGIFNVLPAPQNSNLWNKEL